MRAEKPEGELFSYVEIETSTACNLRCAYCPNSMSDRGLVKNNRQMPEALFRRLVDELVDLGFNGEFHPHFYNEPLLDERLPRLLGYVRERLPLCRIVVFTNGVRLTLEKYLELTAAGINALIVTRHTRDEPPDMARIEAHRRQMGDAGIDIEYHREGITRGIIFNRCGLVPLRKTVQNSRSCTWPSAYLTINYRGDVLLCCNDYQAEFPVGNVTSRSIREIWEKPYNVALRQMLRHDTGKVDICRRCQIGFF